ncbi:hypothetical protein Q3H58_003698 [Pseudomonas psychrotolerans]|nr:hypothetical protein [Pseudomonas psychrotolerans]
MTFRNVELQGQQFVIPLSKRAATRVSKTRRASFSPGWDRTGGFDGIVTSCVFGWEGRADESSAFMRREIQKYVDRYWPGAPPGAAR